MTGKRATDLVATSIVGRHREQERLRQLLDRALDGRGGLALVSGEAGIGKSTLVDELAREARRRGALVLSGACYDLTTTPPYGPWTEAVRSLSSQSSEPRQPSWIESPEDLESFGSQDVLFEEARRFFAGLASERSLVIVLEDLHWSDPASLEVLRYLARESDPISLLLVATFRADEVARDHHLFTLLPLLVREAGAARIELASLTAADVRELLGKLYILSGEDEARLAGYLQQRAEGNPFYVTEVLRVLEHERLLRPAQDGWRVGKLEDAPLPPLARQVIEGRLARLDPDVQRSLEIAAVIGQNVPLGIWRAASGVDDAELAAAVGRAIDAHLIVERPDPAILGFTHALVRETLYLRQPLQQRRLLHQRVAEILATRPEPPLNEVAFHFARADDPRAVDWLVRAGERALAFYATNDAISALTRAHELAGRSGLDLSLNAYRMRASAHAITGDFERARRDYEFVLDRARTTGERAVEWKALIDLGMLWAERDYERTGNYCRTALDLARDIDDQQMIGHSLNRIANWHVNLDEVELALPLHREALEIFEQRGDEEAVADTLDFLGMASYLGTDLDASTDYYERAITIFRNRDNRQRLAGCLAALALNGGEMNSEFAAPVYRESAFWIGRADEALALAREIGWRAGEALALFTLSMTTGIRGNLGLALESVEEMLAISERVDHRQWTVAGRFTLGWIRMALLDLEQASVEMEQALATARLSRSRFWIISSASALAIIRTAAGDLDHAAAVLSGVTVPDELGVSAGGRFCWFAQGTLAHARGDLDRALSIVERLEATRARPVPDHGIPTLMKLHGDVLVRLGRDTDAERKYLAARDAASLFGFRPLLWRIEAARGDLYKEMGRREDALAALQSATSTQSAIAWTINDESMRRQFLARARTVLADEPASGQLSPAVQLSPREIDVLRLLTDGMSDREIAEQLFISPRTVMRHVTSILNKLNVPSRTAAATTALRRNIV